MFNTRSRKLTVVLAAGALTMFGAASAFAAGDDPGGGGPAVARARARRGPLREERATAEVAALSVGRTRSVWGRRWRPPGSPAQPAGRPRAPEGAAAAGAARPPPVRPTAVVAAVAA